LPTKAIKLRTARSATISQHRVLPTYIISFSIYAQPAALFGSEIYLLFSPAAPTTDFLNFFFPAKKLQSSMNQPTWEDI
jgi:hypothetical protein